MAERGKALYAYLSSGSNNVVARRPVTLYGIDGAITAGAFVRVDDSHSFPQGAFNLNSATSNTVGFFAVGTQFTPGIGLNSGMVVAFASNALGVTIEYE